MSIVGKYAVISLSDDRKNENFKDLKLGECLKEKELAPFVGLVVVNLESGYIEHRLEIRGPVEEIYDCIQIPAIKNSSLLGVKSDETRFMLRPAPLRSK